jgi:DNA-directed RNA polymerase subunit alpha
MDFQIPKIVSEDADERSGRFTIEPLDRGFGYTFGNSLRRVLLSSLEGAAVTAVKIEGVSHEFTTLPGVREDVTDIILNLKDLVCRLHGESPEVEVYISKKGPGVVSAGDIEAPADLEILNPDLELAHLADKAKLEMTLTIGRGRGYVPAELNRGPETSIGVIPIDSIFSPVRRVSYEVDAARVGQRTDYDRLTLDVTTDGSVEPKDAIAEAAEILIRQLAIFTDLDKIEGFGEPVAGEAEVPSTAHGMENFPIEELELGVRSYNCLKRVGIETIGDLTSKSEAELGAIPNFGKKSIDEVRETLAAHGPTLKGKKLGRDAAHRKALYSNLAGALITHGRIETTEAKAKAVRPYAERMITLGKRGDLHARRQAMAELRSNDVVHRLFADVAPRFAERDGGYTRIVKLGPRQGDAASMALLELVDYDPAA